jgi:uncharacterized protein YoxC
MANLATTNVLLGIMAAVSVLEGLLIIGIGIGAWITYRRLSTLVANLEIRHVVPVMARVNAILDDVKAVSATLKVEAERVDDAIQRVDEAVHRTMERVDATAQRVHTNVRAKTSRVVGFVIGLRKAVEHFTDSQRRNAATRNAGGVGTDA